MFFNPIKRKQRKNCFLNFCPSEYSLGAWLTRGRLESQRGLCGLTAEEVFISVAHLQGETQLLMGNVNVGFACVIVLFYVNLEWFSFNLLLFA